MPVPVNPTRSYSTGNRWPRPCVAPLSYSCGSHTPSVRCGGIAERVVRQDLRAVLQHHDGAAGPRRTFPGHADLLRESK